MNQKILKRAFTLGAIAVLLGAFGSHGLKKIADDRHIEIYQTAVRYLFYHVFAIAIAGILFKEFANKWILFSAHFFEIGILLFCGSLLYLTFFDFPLPILGLITPVGGLFFMVGWLLLFAGIAAKTTDVNK